MCQGKERCEYYLDNLMRKKENNETSKKDEDTIGDLKVVQEMYARGYEFEPIDLYRAKAPLTCQPAVREALKTTSRVIAPKASGYSACPS